MMKFRLLLFVLFMLSSVLAHGQKREREFRIKEGDFPKNALTSLETYMKNARRTRFYKEFDGEKTSYEAKFKKDRLFYSVEFNADGLLEDVEFIISEDDIPEASFDRIEEYIEVNFDRNRIKKIQQQYPKQETEALTLREAFQNLLLPYLNYEIIISTKAENGFEEYELLFDANGKFLNSRKSIPQKYDHVLY